MRRVRPALFTIALGVAVALATGCSDDESSSGRTGATRESATARTEPNAEPTSTTAPSPTDQPRSTARVGGATKECPSGEYPIAGAVNATDGAVKWLVCSPDEAYRTVIGANDDIVLIEESGHTIAFDASDGSERWRRSTGGSVVPPGPIDGQGIVVLADQDANALVGVDVATGDERWRVTSSEVPIAHGATIAVVGEDSSQNGSSRFRGIDRVTGNEVWVSGTPLSDQSGNFLARLALLAEILAVPTGTTITAVDMRNGKMLWEAPQLDDPAAADGTIVGVPGSPSSSGPPSGPPSRMIRAIDAASGEERWTAPGVPSYGVVLAVGDGVVVVRHLDERSGLVAYVAYELSSGDERWRATQTTAGDPQMIMETSVVMLWEGELAVRSTTDGAVIWSTTEPFGTTLMSSVGSNRDSVFVAMNSLPWTD